MINPIPAWTFTSQKSLTQWYGHVHLLADHVVGQWICLERPSGKLQWQTKLHRANTFCGTDSGVIVASETRSDGPWTTDFGCYGISLEFGTLLWTSHGEGMRGRFSRMLDFIPGFTNELRDSPHHVENGQVFCTSGRVLEVKTGKLLKKIPPDDVQSHEPSRPIAWQFYASASRQDSLGVMIGDGVLLRHLQEEGKQSRDLKIVAESEAGSPLWSFSPEMLGKTIDGNFYSYRLVPPYFYLVVSDEPGHQPHPTQKHHVVPNPTLWHLVTVDLRTGSVIQRISLGDDRLEECRIEDVDNQGLLIGRSNRSLVYFLRQV